MTKLLYLTLCLFFFTSSNVVHCSESSSATLQSCNRQKGEATPLQRRVLQGGGTVPPSLKLEKKDKKPHVPSPLRRSTTLVAEGGETSTEESIGRSGAMIGIIPLVSAMNRLRIDSTLPSNLGDKIPQKTKS